VRAPHSSMEAFCIAGSAEDPTFAEAELLADYLVKSLPSIGLTKHMRHPSEWEEFRSKISHMFGFNCPGNETLVWRRDGRLVGGTSDFRRLLKDTYNLELERNAELIVAITSENKDSVEKTASADAWSPYLGKMKKEWDNGVTYEGTWKLHKPTKGSVRFPDGSTFDGTLKDGKFHGHGRHCFANGAKFVGTFAHGAREGNGRFQDAEGNVYDGSFSRGVCHGKGTRTWASGREYVGEWVDNEATGRGTQTLPVTCTVEATPAFWSCKVLSTEWTGADGLPCPEENGKYFGFDLEEAKRALACVHQGAEIEHEKVYKISSSSAGARQIKVFINAQKDDKSKTAQGTAHARIEPEEHATTEDWGDRDVFIFLDDVQYAHATGEGEGDEPPPPTKVVGKQTYTGEFLKGNFHGSGYMEYENGDTYEGDWVHGRREGNGLYTWTGKLLTFDGTFDADAPTYGMLRFERAEARGGDITTPYPGEITLSKEDASKNWQRGLRQATLESGGWLDSAQERKPVTDMYDEYPVHDAQANAMVRALPHERWNLMHRRLTPGGITLHSCIAPGLDPKNTHPLGLQACDSDCYTVFRELFDDVIRSAHKGFDPRTDNHPSDMDDAESWQKIKTLSPALLEVAVAWKLQIDRSIGSLPCAKLIDLDNRRRVEEIVVGALLKLEDESLKGEYYPLEKSESWAEKSGGMSASEVDQLRAIGALFDETNCSDVRDWPDARGVFISDNKKLIVHINKEEHVSFFCLGCPNAESGAPEHVGLQIQEMFRLISQALSNIEERMFEDDQQTYARSDNLGFLLSSVNNLGTGMKLNLTLKLPKLTKRQSIDFVTSKTGMTLTNVPIPAEGKKIPMQDMFALSVPQKLGTSETHFLNALIEGANELAKHEKTLAVGRKKLWLLEERPKVLLIGAAEVLADDITHASRLAKEFDLDLITSESAVQTEIDKGSKLGKTAKWYQDAGKPVTREVVSECILEALKRTEARANHVRFAGAGPAGWICCGFPGSLVELEELAKTEIKANKIISLKPDDATVQKVIARRLSRRRDKFSRRVFYLEDEPDKQAADRDKNSYLEKLSEDRGDLPSQAPNEFKANYDKLHKNLSKFGPVESFVSHDPEELAKGMFTYISTVPTGSH
jgi:adenylate kinase family enzyme